jgi:hypothetical protein
MAVLKQSTTYKRMFKMISSTDHLSLKASASPVVNISKNGGAFAAAGGAVTEVANGWYYVSLNTTDTNTLGDLAFYITGTGADDTDFCDQVTGNILGDTLPVNATQINGVSTSNVTTVNANVGQTQPVNFTGTGASALVKSDSVDIGGAAAASATVGTVTTVTNQLTAAQIATGVWQDTAAGDFTVASSIGKSLYTSGVVPGGAGGIFIAGSNAATTVNFTGTISTVTTLTNLPSIPANWLTAAGINASALNGKGDWLLASSYTAPPTTAQIATAVWQDTTAGDFANASSPGKILVTQLGGAFTSTSSSIFTTGALANGPGGGGNVTVGGYAAGQDPATLVLDVVASLHNGANTIGAKINSAGGAADPLANAVPGSYLAGTAGYALGNGVKLASSGVDLIVCETGFNLRQSVALILDFCFGSGSGAPNGPILVSAVGSPAVQRASVTIDNYSNRKQVVLTPPT